ncbi:ABC transporter substrate-binding protein [Sneathiella marina]|uniref:ABC transporter substrate-binding protein n=1 Tax=Sneathiella marina TaxID=2950108 RepID=A0ABY4W6N1_9PROT|nr:ABC transporter substrate-binding protein [Sneathiella marina]USG60311.1 ABC transporter substrate-binding protein [Sneathiella marina]
MPATLGKFLFIAFSYCVFTLIFVTGTKAEPTVTLHYIERVIDRPPVLSNLHALPEDQGLLGARLGVSDVNATGKFTNHEIRLIEHILEPEDNLSDLASKINGENIHIIANLPSADLLELANFPWKNEAVIINTVEKDNSLRREKCHKNVLHTIPSRAMLSDALAQFLLLKRWQNWFLVEGVHEGDRHFALALRDSAKKFGAKIVDEKKWVFDADMRRSAQSEVPPFTQGSEYDVVVVADESGDFGDYLLYHTWYPRPVVGTQGMFPTAWHPVVEQYGATQLQNRFKKLAKRPMNDVDYAAWLAVSSIGEAVIRGNKKSAIDIKTYLFSDAFRVAAFKGRALTFRPWSGQMRQPIPLVHRGAVVSMSPQPGFLHQRTELDTLGLDSSNVARCGEK